MNATYIRRCMPGTEPPFSDAPGRLRLVRLRNYAGLSIEAFCARIGMDPDRWRDIEDGWERLPSGQLLTRWARFLEDQASPNWNEAA